MEEIWKDVKGFEGLYSISNFGKVKSMERFVKNGKDKQRLQKEHEVKTYINWNRNGYVYCNLYKDNKAYPKKVHRLIAEAFILNPDNLPQVNHKDGNKQNNCVDNLEWVTDVQNKKHGWDNKLYTADHRKQKIKCIQTGEIFESVVKCSEIMNIDRRSIFRQLKGEKEYVKGYSFIRI